MFLSYMDQGPCPFSTNTKLYVPHIKFPLFHPFIYALHISIVSLKNDSCAIYYVVTDRPFCRMLTVMTYKKTKT